MTGPGISDVDDFNSHYIIKLHDIPQILDKQKIYIPTVYDYKGRPETVLVESIVPAHQHAVFIINNLYILKWDAAIKEAKRILGSKDTFVRY